MRAPSVPVVLFCAFLRSAGAGRSSLAAWTATPLINSDRSARCSKKGFRTPDSLAPRAPNSSAARSREFAAALPRRRRPITPLCATGSDVAEAENKSMFIFGVGYVATAIALSFLRKGWIVHGTCTDPRKVKQLGDQGIQAYIFDDWSGPMMKPEPLDALASATCVLSTVPPVLQSGADPVLVAHEPELQWAYRNGSLRWVGYLSSTGVYGDRGGGWVTEEDEPWPSAPRTKARLKAERSWLRLHEQDGLPTHVFRLAGIYGPGRSALDAVARHSGDIRLAGSDDGTMVSRIHTADILGVVEASIERPEPGMVVNVADDLPSTRYETLAYGCKLLGYPRQDPDPSEKYVNRRGGGNKRVDNGKMRALLAASGRSLVFPDYRVGLRALHEGDSRPFTQPENDPAGNGKLSASPRTNGTHPANNGSASSSEDAIITISAELKALSDQVSRVEANLDKVLAALGSAAGDGDAINRLRSEVETGDTGGVDETEKLSLTGARLNAGREGPMEASGGVTPSSGERRLAADVSGSIDDNARGVDVGEEGGAVEADPSTAAAMAES